MRNELTTERQNALPSTDYDAMIVLPTHTAVVRHSLKCPPASSMLSTAQGRQGRCLYQQVLEVAKYPNSDDNGGFFSTRGCWLSVLQAMRRLRSLESVFPAVFTSILLENFSISICWSIMASP